MANDVKEKIAADLQKAKSEGGLRVERIREIVKSAVLQAVGEVKEGSGEIRTIATDAIAAVVDQVKEKGKEVNDDISASISASIEGVVEGIKESRQDAFNKTQTQVDHLQADLDAQTQTLEAEVDGALMAMEETAHKSTTDSDLKAQIIAAILAFRESKQFLAMQEQYTKLRAQMTGLDERLAERYGDRYAQVKHQLEKYWETVKVWYDKTKTEAKNGSPDPIQRMQVELGAKMAEAGAAAARKEKEAKERLKVMLKKEADTHISDAH